MTMEEYILQSSSACEDLLHHQETLDLPSGLYKKQKPETIWLVASGSSYNACICAQPLMNKWMDSNVEVRTPFTFLHYTPTLKKNDLIFVITQSGLSTNAIEVLDAFRSYENLICLTGNKNSDVKDHADCVLEYGVGEELVGYVTKGVNVLLFWLICFAKKVSDQKNTDLYAVLDTFKDTENKTRHFIEKHYKSLSGMQTVYCLGTPYSQGAGMEAALKIGETIHVPSFYYEVEEFIHGPNLQLDPTYTLFFFDSNDSASGRLQKIYESAKSISDHVYLITMDQTFKTDANAIVIEPRIDALYSSFAELPFPQLISAVISSSLHSTMQHPLLKEFKKGVAAKTSNFINYDNDEA